MKFVSYNKDDQDQLAILADGLLYDTDLLHPDLPVSMSMFLNYWEDVYTITNAINKKLEEGRISRQQGIDYDAVEILQPVPHATSFRNAYTFPLQTAPTEDKQSDQNLHHYKDHPVFYFSNHNCFQGAGDIVCMPDHLQKLDFEPGIAIVICKAGKNIKAADADEYIGGFMLLNNLCSSVSADDNTVLDLSSARGKGFAIPLGPILVTPDELEPFKVETKQGHTGNSHNFSIKCFVNGVEVTEINSADMTWTFAEIIQEASYGVQLFPGDIIASSFNSECFSKLNKAGKQNHSGYEEQWLKEGDVIEIEADGLGKLSNTIVKDESEFSLLDHEISS